MRTLLYPAPADYKFEKHSYIFVEFLALIAVLGFVYTVVMKVSYRFLGEDRANGKLVLRRALMP